MHINHKLLIWQMHLLASKWENVSTIILKTIYHLCGTYCILALANKFGCNVKTQCPKLENLANLFTCYSIYFFMSIFLYTCKTKYVNYKLYCNSNCYMSVLYTTTMHITQCTKRYESYLAMKRKRIHRLILYKLHTLHLPFINFFYPF